MTHCHSLYVCTKFPSSRLIFGQKSYFLGTTIYEIPKTKITLLSTGILTYLSNLDKIFRPMKDEIQNSRGWRYVSAISCWLWFCVGYTRLKNGKPTFLHPYFHWYFYKINANSPLTTNQLKEGLRLHWMYSLFLKAYRDKVVLLHVI